MIGNRQQARKWSGFTLIEVLVVIGIIALLAAVLFPVFVRARGKGHQATCASNLKQIGLATFLYTQDDDGMMFPTLGHASDDGDVTEWCFRKVARNPNYSLDKSGGYLSRYIKSEGIWTCPAEPDLMIPYGVNIAFLRAEVAGGHPIQFAQVSAPSETILATERASNSSNWWDQKPAVYLPSDRAALARGRHFGLANVLWIDGHISARRPIASYSVKAPDLTVQQLQQLNRGDILKGGFTGDTKQNDYYYELLK